VVGDEPVEQELAHRVGLADLNQLVDSEEVQLELGRGFQMLRGI
jgi:hypothetical protein